MKKLKKECEMKQISYKIDDRNSVEWSRWLDEGLWHEMVTVSTIQDNGDRVVRPYLRSFKVMNWNSPLDPMPEELTREEAEEIFRESTSL